MKHGNETPSHQARLLGLAEVAFGWSLHDVMFLTLFTATPQLPTYVQYLLRQVRHTSTWRMMRSLVHVAREHTSTWRRSAPR